MHKWVVSVAMIAGLGGCLADETVSGYADKTAVWQLQAVNGAPFKARATIAFPTEGTITGQAPCNRYTARQTVPYPWISVDRIAATKMACPDLASEGSFFAALQAMTLVEVAGDTLLLTNDKGEEMVFRQSP